MDVFATCVSLSVANTYRNKSHITIGIICVHLGPKALINMHSNKQILFIRFKITLRLCDVITLCHTHTHTHKHTHTHTHTHKHTHTHNQNLNYTTTHSLRSIDNRSTLVWQLKVLIISTFFAYIRCGFVITKPSCCVTNGEAYTARSVRDLDYQSTFVRNLEVLIITTFFAYCRRGFVITNRSSCVNQRFVNTSTFCDACVGSGYPRYAIYPFWG